MSIEVYPVVHVQDTAQAIEQSSAAFELGADGIYLIDHVSPSGETDRLVKSYVGVAALYPEKFIGLNFLQFSSSYVSFRFIDGLAERDEIPRLPDGLWVDDASITTDEAAELRHDKPHLQDVKYLGGVAFKYTPGYTDNPGEAALQASRFSAYVDVVTTSGVGTGQAASTEKAARMKEAIGPQRLALASGVDGSNIAAFRGHVDEILVATSIETAPQSGIFDPAKLENLLTAAHQK